MKLHGLLYVLLATKAFKGLRTSIPLFAIVQLRQGKGMFHGQFDIFFLSDASVLSASFQTARNAFLSSSPFWKDLGKNLGES